LVDDLDSFVSGLGSGDGGLFIPLPAPWPRPRGGAGSLGVRGRATLAFALLEVGTIECPDWRRPGRPHPGRPGRGRRRL